MSLLREQVNGVLSHTGLCFWRIRKVTMDAKGKPMVVLDNTKRLATMDGLKV